MKRTLITTGKVLASSLVITMAFSTTAMAQAKSTSTAPQTDVEKAQPNAISYGSTRSNKKTHIMAPSGETTDVGNALPNAISYGSTRSNKPSPIAAPAGCVTEAGAKDVNCDGVDDDAILKGNKKPGKKKNLALAR